MNKETLLKNKANLNPQLTAKQQAKLDSWKAWGNKMSLLRTIHQEVEPQLEARRQVLGD